MRRILLIVAVVFAGCHKPERPKPAPPTVDYPLRAFMGIKTLDAPFVLPKLATTYYPVFLFFADGEEIAQVNGPAMMDVGSQQQPYSGDIQLLWQSDDHNQFQRAALVDGPNMYDMSHGFPYWQNFSSGGFGWRAVPMDEGLSYRDVSILGLLASSDTPQLYPTSKTLPNAGRYVVAIGIVYGSDRKAMESRFFSSPPEQDRSVQWPKVLGQIGRIDNDATTIYELKCMFNITFLGNNPDVLKESKPTYGGKYDATAWVIRMCGPLSPVAHVELDTRTNTFTVRGLGKDLPITAALFDRFYPLNIRKVESNGETSKIP